MEMQGTIDENERMLSQKNVELDKQGEAFLEL